MEHVRWYDKKSDLKEVFEFIKGLDFETQSDIAKDIIQLLMGDFDLNIDQKINEISKNYNFKCNRWYDKNIDLYTSFEIIKGLPESMQKQVVDKIVATILLMYISNI